MSIQWQSGWPQFLCWAMIWLALPAFAQGEPRDDDALLPPASGDSVYLKGGGIIQGAQVIRANAFVVELRTLPELPPLVLPKRQVTRIDYDEHDPAAWDTKDMEPQPSGNAEVVIGTRLSQDFDRKLFTPIPVTTLRIEDADFVSVLIDLAQRLDIPLKISESVHEIPAKDRRWTVQIEAGTTFITLLRENLSSSFPGVRIVFNYDNVTLTERADTPKP